jgi:hypothetical protein
VIAPYAAAVAAYGLPGAPPLPDEPLLDDAFTILLADCEYHRILGLLGVAVRDGAFPVNEEQRARLEEAWTGWLAHAVRVEQLVLDTTVVLETAGIRSIVLKGLALAHTVYPSPETRVFGDVDLLVEPHNFTRAARTLAAATGAERALPELRSGFDDRFGKEILLRAGDIEIDLHRMFVEGPYGLTMRLADLWESPEPFRLANRELLALGAVPRSLHAAYAAALGDWPLRLVPARDLAQMLTTTDVTIDELLAMARRWRAEAVVPKALARVSEVIGLPASPNQIAVVQREPSRRDARYLASYGGDGRGYSRQLGGVAVLDGLGSRIRYIVSIALPSREYLAARGLRRLDFMRVARARLRARQSSAIRN